MPQNLTGKQARFAFGVAVGQSLVDAYRAAYEPTNPTAVSVYSNARRARKHPGIARRIAELQVTLLPGPEDMQALYRHALAVGTQLSLLGRDDRIRLRAAQWIASEAEKRGKIAEGARKLSDEDLEELQAILGSPAAEDEARARSAEEFRAELRHEPPVKQQVPKPATTEIRYEEKCVSPPGHFPPRFVKVAVRNPAGPEGA